ncbi:MAG: LytR family transcriptional regulator [Cryobacterium sp.]|nr:LytR family transcriptional regulator [Cryobacterium sp.]
MRGDGTFTDLPRLLALANVASRNIQLSTSLAYPETMVSMALAIKDIDLDRLVFVQYPGATDDPAYPGKVVVPIRGLADTLFGNIAPDEPFSLAAQAPPEAPVVAEEPAAEQPVGTPAPTNAATPAPEVVEGLTGRTAADESCAEAARS